MLFELCVPGSHA